MEPQLKTQKKVSHNRLVVTPGGRYDRLTIIKEVQPKYQYARRFECKCDCGKTTITHLYSLRDGRTRSCGCLNREISRITSKYSTRTHGLSMIDGKKTRLYNIWILMRKRCQRKNSVDYKYYGGRGIKVCDEWNDYTKFHKWATENGYCKDLTIERTNNDGDYCPGNCKWIPKASQSCNTRLVKFLDFNGERLPQSQMARKYNIPLSTLRKRLKAGRNLNEALTTKQLNKH